MFEFFRPSIDTWLLALFARLWWCRQQRETATAPQGPPVWPQKIKMYMSHPDFRWWPKGDHADGTWSTAQLCHGLSLPAPVRWDWGSTQCLFLQALHQQIFFLWRNECLGLIPNWLKFAFYHLMCECRVNLTCFYIVPFIFNTVYVGSARVGVCRSWPLVRWDAASGLVQAGEESCCQGACGFMSDCHNRYTWPKFV